MVCAPCTNQRQVRTHSYNHLKLPLNNQVHKRYLVLQNGIEQVTKGVVNNKDLRAFSAQLQNVCGIIIFLHIYAAVQFFFFENKSNVNCHMALMIVVICATWNVAIVYKRGKCELSLSPSSFIFFSNSYNRLCNCNTPA